MAKICTTDRSIARQKRIANALCALMQEKHYHDINITEICDRAEVPRRSFYRYFADKDDILNGVLLEIVRRCDLYVMLEYWGDGRNVERLTMFYPFGKVSMPIGCVPCIKTVWNPPW